ncbi:MAG: hypothetical protein E7095_10665 [Bacteroides sp.]|nr:hypothetical protein [Bacteroides sp.]
MDNENRQKRLKEVIAILNYLHVFPLSMRILRKIMWRNAFEYSCSLDSETSIYRIPNELFSADELLSKVDVWEVFKKEWYKDLGNNISVGTTYDFEDRKDEMSIL